MNYKSKHKRTLPFLLFAVMVMSILSCSSTKGLSSYQIKAHAFINDIVVNEKYALNLDVMSLDTLQYFLVEDYFENDAPFTQRMTEQNNFKLEYVYSEIKTQVDYLKNNNLYNTKWQSRLIKFRKKSDKYVKHSYPFFIDDTNIAVVLTFYPTVSNKVAKNGVIYTTAVLWSFYKYEKNHWVGIGEIQVSGLI